MSEPVMPLHRRRPEVTYRGPAPAAASPPLSWELRLFLLALGLAFAVYAFVQWLETP